MMSNLFKNVFVAFFATAAFLLSPQVLLAATITINSTGDTRTASDGSCDLAEAIDNANNDLDTTGGDCTAGAGPDNINFNIGGGGVQTITIASDLPAVTSEIHVDGITQDAGASCDPRNLFLSIDGNNATQKIFYFLSGSQNSTVTGLNMYGTTIAAIDIATDSITVTCNNIGTNLTGTAVAPVINADSGIRFEGPASLSVIGGSTAAARNIISGSNFTGVWLIGPGVDDNTIQGNYIGTDITGTIAIPNGSGGINIVGGGDGNLIGGNSTLGEGNLISGNGGVGVATNTASNTEIKGNIIGLDVTGSVALPNASSGIDIYSSISTVIGGPLAGERNLISGNSLNGIHNDAATFTVVKGNFIGTDITGTINLGNGGHGITLANQSDNYTIGGPLAGEMNLISGNNGDGIDIASGDDAVIQGNYIGTDISGLLPIPNTLEGINISGGSGTRDNALIGGNRLSGEGNLLSGNNANGISLFDTTNATIKGNIIGLTSDGLAQLQNTGNGINANLSTGLTIGGAGTGEGNIISGNNQIGIGLFSNSNNAVVKGNFIGTDITGTVDIGNDQDGIQTSDSSLIQIGGPGLNERNVIAGNGSGAFGPSGINIGNSSSLITVQGNYIGLDAAGNPMGNDGFGINLGGSNNLIGGSAPGEGNVVSANGTSGVLIVQTGPAIASDNIIQGNLIGTNSTGSVSSGFGNALFAGVLVVFGAEDNMIGGTSAGAGNVIAGNDGAGVMVFNIPFFGTSPLRNAILGNSIFGNGSFGIEEATDSDGNTVPDEHVGADTNDPSDTDSGPNDYLNHPILYNILPAGPGMSQVDYFLDVPAGNYRVEFFKNSVADPSNHGEGETFVDFDSIAHSGGGVQFFSEVIPADPGDIITATATVDLGLGAYGPTSEFSPTTVVAGTGVDFGDAPDTGIGTSAGNYHTLASDRGAYHVIDGTLFFGECIDADLGNLQSANADADDGSTTLPFSGGCPIAGDDEDGVNLPSSINEANDFNVNVVSSAPGYLNAWVDFNRDGDFDDTGEQIFTNNALIAGPNALSAIAPSLISSGVSYARLRLSPTTGAGPYDEVIGGEVQDYKVTLVNNVAVGSGGGSGGSGGSAKFGKAASEGPTTTSTSQSLPDNNDSEPTCENSNVPLPFEDVKGHWAHQWIDNLFHRCIVHGRTGDLFKPDEPATRAEVVKIAVRLYKLGQANHEVLFSDVDVNDWFAPYVTSAAKGNVLIGFPTKTGKPEFRPHQEITRAEALKVLLLAKGTDINNEKTNYDDVNVTDWYYGIVAYATKHGIIEGYAEKSGKILFKPNQPITRAEVAKIAKLVEDLE